MVVPLELEARVLTAGAELAKAGAEYDQARQLYKDAIAALERLHGSFSMEVAVVCLDIAEMLDEAGHCSESHQYLERMREIVSYQKHHCETAVLV